MPSQKIYEDEKVLAFLDIRPLNPGHALIIPKAHSGNMLESDEETMLHVMRVARKLGPIIKQAVGADALNFTTNIGRAAGQIVFHTHFHIIPRFSTDGYAPWTREDDGHDDLEEVAEKIRKELTS